MAKDDGRSSPQGRLIKEAMRTQPAVSFALAVAGVIAAASLVLTYLAVFNQNYELLKYAGATFAAMLVGMIFFWIFRILVDPANKIAVLTGRLAGLVLVIGMFLGLGTVLSAVLVQRPCNVAALLLNEDQIYCSIVESTVEGTIGRDDVTTAFVPNAIVYLRGTGTVRIAANELGDFRHPLKQTDLGRSMQVWATADGYENSPVRTVTPVRGLNHTTFTLRPRTDRPPPPPPQPIVPPVPVGQPPTEPRSATPIPEPSAPWFNGLGWKFDMFYCQTPDGDARRSRQASEQLAQVLRGQRGVGEIRVRPWPISGTTFQDDNNVQWVYAQRDFPISINVSQDGVRDRMARELSRLWGNAAKNIGPIGTQIVGSSYTNYISVVICLK